MSNERLQTASTVRLYAACNEEERLAAATENLLLRCRRLREGNVVERLKMASDPAMMSLEHIQSLLSVGMYESWFRTAKALTDLRGWNHFDLPQFKGGRGRIPSAKEWLRTGNGRCVTRGEPLGARSQQGAPAPDALRNVVTVGALGGAVRAATYDAACDGCERVYSQVYRAAVVAKRGTTSRILQEDIALALIRAANLAHVCTTGHVAHQYLVTPSRLRMVVASTAWMRHDAVGTEGDECEAALLARDWRPLLRGSR